MSKKLLNERQIRRFMELADLPAITETGLYGDREEEGEDPVGDMPPGGPEGMDMPPEEDVEDEEGMEDLEELPPEGPEGPSEPGMGGVEDELMEMLANEVDLLDDKEVVDNVMKRVAERLVGESRRQKKNRKIEALAERIANKIASKR